jgi:surface antigen
MMRFRNLFVKLFWDRLLVAPLCLASVLGTLAHADAATRHPHHHHRLVAASRHETRYARRGSSHHGHARLQCVPYARRVSGIELTGNADRWWREADGRYARGHAPELDAVLSFKRSGRMPLGHVAVVTKTVNPRQVLVTQANWPSFGWRGGDISKAASVIDVSPDNDWTEVRVQVGHSAVYGAVYRTDGFIYGHAPSETLMADAAGKTAPVGVPSGEAAGWGPSVQLASAPNDGGPAIAASAPDREIR